VLKATIAQKKNKHSKIKLSLAVSHSYLQQKKIYSTTICLLLDPVLEAYGNAKTTRNNNSSRFVNILFDLHAHMFFLHIFTLVFI